MITLLFLQKVNQETANTGQRNVNDDPEINNNNGHELVPNNAIGSELFDEDDYLQNHIPRGNASPKNGPIELIELDSDDNGKRCIVSKKRGELHPRKTFVRIVTFRVTM